MAFGSARFFQVALWLNESSYYMQKETLSTTKTINCAVQYTALTKLLQFLPSN